MSVVPETASQGHPSPQSLTAEGNPVKPISVCVIGDIHRREFGSLQQRLITDDRLQVHRRYDSIQDAVLEPDVIESVQLTIVLQSWSEQYARRDIHHLIGLTFSRRLICFCGPWCESDGRNHDLWPDALRVPVREVSSRLSAVSQQIMEDAPVLPPTAARDEVFADRVPSAPDQSTVRQFAQLNAAVIGPDATLRRTMAIALKSFGVRTAVRSLITVVPYQTIAPVQTPRGPIHLVFHDLDPFSSLVQQSLDGCQQMFPEAEIIGVANMPDAGLISEIADVNLAAVLAKLNLLADMQHWLVTNRAT